MSKKINVITEDEGLVYQISIKEKKNKTVYKITNPNDTGEDFIKVVDDGDGITIGDQGLSYSDFEALFTIMKAVVRHDKKIVSNQTHVIKK
jgi:hypothetical protein